MISLKIHRTILLFFLKPLLLRTILCCAVFSALLEVLGLFEEASTILARNLGFYGIAKYTLLHLPTLASEIMPLSIMIGSLFTLLQMTLSSEISAMRASGLSTFDMFKHLLPAPIIIGIFTMIIQFWVVPPCEQELNIWWNESASKVNDQNSLHSLWFRSGDDIAHIDQIREGGRYLKGITLYTRNHNSGLLEKLYYFESLKETPLGWKNDSDVLKTITQDDENRKIITLPTDSNVLKASSRQIINMMLEDTFYTPYQILKSIQGSIPSNLPLSNYIMALFSGIFLPIQMAIMILITLPITYIPPRTGLRNPLPIYVLASGLSIIILQGMISALGNAGSLPVLLAVSSGHIIATLLSLAWIYRMEEK